jgi:hypothetical protein
MASLPSCPHCGKAAPVWMIFDVDDTASAEFDAEGVMTDVAYCPILGSQVFKCSACKEWRSDLVLEVDNPGREDEMWYLDARRAVSDGG